MTQSLDSQHKAIFVEMVRKILQKIELVWRFLNSIFLEGQNEDIATVVTPFELLDVPRMGHLHCSPLPSSPGV